MSTLKHGLSKEALKSQLGRTERNSKRLQLLLERQIFTQTGLHVRFNRKSDIVLSRSGLTILTCNQVTRKYRCFDEICFGVDDWFADNFEKRGTNDDGVRVIKKLPIRK